MTHAQPPQVTLYVVHIVRGVQRIWTNPEGLTRDAAHAYVDSFNQSLRARTHQEYAIVVEQKVFAELPHDIIG